MWPPPEPTCVLLRPPSYHPLDGACTYLLPHFTLTTLRRPGRSPRRSTRGSGPHCKTGGAPVHPAASPHLRPCPSPPPRGGLPAHLPQESPQPQPEHLCEALPYTRLSGNAPGPAGAHRDPPTPCYGHVRTGAQRRGGLQGSVLSVCKELAKLAECWTGRSGLLSGQMQLHKTPGNTQSTGPQPAAPLTLQGACAHPPTGPTLHPHSPAAVLGSKDA